MSSQNVTSHSTINANSRVKPGFLSINLHVQENLPNENNTFLTLPRDHKDDY